jgi:molecular chaperone GrpE
MNEQKKAVDAAATAAALAAENGATAEELAKLRKLASERDQYLDLAQRGRAEFENYQKRNQKEREQERKYAYGPLAYDLLPVLDNLDRTLNAAQSGGDAKALVQGVAMVQKQFLEMLKRHGITRVEAAPGMPFDPNVHQAVMQKPTEEMEPGTVVDVHEQGYMNQDRVLRPAKVAVSAKPA